MAKGMKKFHFFLIPCLLRITFTSISHLIPLYIIDLGDGQFSERCDTDYFLEKLNIAIVAIIFLDHRERLFFDYFAHFRTDYFGIII